MNVYENLDLAALLADNTYPGRGIIIGKSEDGTKAVPLLVLSSPYKPDGTPNINPEAAALGYVDCMKEIADSDSRILKDPAPFYALVNLGDSSVDFTFRVWVKGADYWDVFFNMNRKVYEEFNKKGIGFPFPQVQVHTN